MTRLTIALGPMIDHCLTTFTIVGFKIPVELTEMSVRNLARIEALTMITLRNRTSYCLLHGCNGYLTHRTTSPLMMVALNMTMKLCMRISYG